RRSGERVIAVGRATSALPTADREIRLAEADSAAIGSALAGEALGVVFNCAAYGVNPGDRDPAAMQAVNIGAAGAWVEAAAALGARGVVHIGSCSEYGAVEHHLPIGEDAPLRATDLYGASKAAGGLWAAALALHRAIPFVWLRPFGIFGPGEAGHRLLPSLHARLRAGARADLSPGAQMRDFLYIDDAAAGIAAAGALAARGGSGIYNLCSGRAVSVRAFAGQAAAALGAPADRLDFAARAYRPGEPMWLVGDPSRLAEATGFRPETTLEDGIRRTVALLDRAGAAAAKAGA
ncbi:MAG: NAD(P)-dependent oxidoreductase, partial [Rhodospirillaceae bacterium]|nr:NAD(P)-dependent oxidoreductase [Rhodospirillaceae bacterium]